jgi:hypothetical protein
MDEQLNPRTADLHVTTAYSHAAEPDHRLPLDVSDAAREAGLRLTVAISRDAWDLCVALNPAATRAGCDEHGRLADVLGMLAWALGRTRDDASVYFEVACLTHGARPTCIPLRAVRDPGSDADAILTVVLPEEIT